MNKIQSELTQPTEAIPQEAFDWYDEYAHGLIDRRTFLTRLGSLAAVGFSMSVLSTALMPNYALAEQVSFNDSEIKASYQTFPAEKGHGEGRGYLVTPAKLDEKAPLLLIVHENRGLNPYIKTLPDAGQKRVLSHLRLMLCTRLADIQVMMMKAEPCNAL